MAKRNIVINTWLKKCPRCQEGDLFNKPFRFSEPVAMPETCPVCHQKFEPEPGFYYGAMFISYIFSGFLFLGIIGLCLIVLDMSLNASMGVVLVVAALTYFFFLRMSRSLWINLLVSYDPEARNKDEVKGFGY